MDRTQKAAFVEALHGHLAEAPFVVLADFRGATVEATNNLRRTFEASGVSFQVVKNTLAKRAIAGTELEGLSPLFKDMTGLIYGGEDAITTAKLVKEHLTGKDAKLSIKGGFFDGEVLDEGGVKAVAELPSKPELQVMLLRTLQEPGRRVLRVLQAPGRDLLYLLKNFETKLAEAEGTE